MSFRVSDGIGSGTPGQVHALVRADARRRRSTSQRGAAVARPVDAQPDEAVVDQHVVARLEHVADHRRARPAARRRGTRPRRTTTIVLALREHDRLGEVADAELRPLQVGDQRDRPAELAPRLADAARALGVLLVRAVREVEPRGVHARGDERAQLLGRVGRRPERGDDLRAALVSPWPEYLRSASMRATRGARRPSGHGSATSRSPTADATRGDCVPTDRADASHRVAEDAGSGASGSQAASAAARAAACSPRSAGASTISSRRRSAQRLAARCGELSPPLAGISQSTALGHATIIEIDRSRRSFFLDRRRNCTGERDGKRLGSCSRRRPASSGRPVGRRQVRLSPAVDAFNLTTLRYAVAAAILLDGLAASRDGARSPRRPGPAPLRLGTLGFAELPTLLAYKGLDLAGARARADHALAPLLMVLLLWRLGSGRPSRRRSLALGASRSSASCS